MRAPLRKIGLPVKAKPAQSVSSVPSLTVERVRVDSLKSNDMFMDQGMVYFVGVMITRPKKWPVEFYTHEIGNTRMAVLQGYVKNYMVDKLIITEKKVVNRDKAAACSRKNVRVISDEHGVDQVTDDGPVGFDDIADAVTETEIPPWQEADPEWYTNLTSQADVNKLDAETLSRAHMHARDVGDSQMLHWIVQTRVARAMRS